MYKVFLGESLLPVPPPKITTKINGNNKTMTLINGVEINQIKPAGLTKLEQNPFQFIITRIDADGTRNYETNMTVTLEDYQRKIIKL